MQSEKDQSNDQGKVMMMMKQNNGNSSNDNSNGNDKAPQKCPRCESLNTKFCYYNNYSLSQPRFFCKTCRRYWTQGGTLRNVPVGGGCRKGKRARTASTTTAISANMASTSSTTSSSEGGGDNSRQVSQAPGAGGGGGAGVVLPRQNQTNPQSIIGSGLMRPVEPFGSQFFQGAGSYLPSFADMNNIQSFNHGDGHDDHHNPLSHQLAELITAPSASTLSLLEGFNFAAFGSQQHHQQQQHQHQIPPSHQFFDASDHHQTMINNRPVVNSNNNHQWTHPSFGAHVNNDSETTPNHSTVDWTIGAANNSTAGNVHTSTTTSGDVPSNSNHRWPTTHHDLSGSYGPPP